MTSRHIWPQPPRARNTSQARRDARKKVPQGVTTAQVPKSVMREALRRADGDATRLEIRPDGTVIVR